MAQIPRPTDNPTKEAHAHARAQAQQRANDGAGQNEEPITSFMDTESDELKTQKKQLQELESLSNTQSLWLDTLNGIMRGVDKLVSLESRQSRKLSESTSSSTSNIDTVTSATSEKSNTDTNTNTRSEKSNTDTNTNTRSEKSNTDTVTSATSEKSNTDTNTKDEKKEYQTFGDRFYETVKGTLDSVVSTVLPQKETNSDVLESEINNTSTNKETETKSFGKTITDSMTKSLKNVGLAMLPSFFKEQAKEEESQERQSMLSGGGNANAGDKQGVVDRAQGIGASIMASLRSIMRIASMFFLPFLAGFLLLLKTMGNEKVQDLVVGIRDLWVNKIWPFFTHMSTVLTDLSDELEQGLGRMMDDFEEGKIIEGIVRIPGLIVDTLVRGIGSLTRLIGEYFNIDWLSEFGSSIEEGAGSLTNLVAGIASSIHKAIQDFFYETFSFIGDMKNSFDEGGIKQLILDLPTNLWNGFKGMISVFTKHIDRLLGTGLTGALSEGSVTGLLLEIPSTIFRGLGNLIGTFTTMIDNVFGTDITSAFNSFRKKFSEIGTQIKGWVKNIVGSFTTFLEDTFGTFIEYIGDLKNAFDKGGILGLIKNLPSIVFKGIKSMIGNVGKLIDGIFGTGLTEAFDKKGLSGLIFEFPRMIMRGVRNLIGTVLTMIDSFFGTNLAKGFDKVWSFFANIGDAVINFVENTVDNIINYFSNLKDIFNKEGLTAFISAIPAQLWGFIKGAFSNIMGFVDDLFGTDTQGDANKIGKWFAENVGFIFDIEWWKEKFNAILEALPGGKYIAKYITGEGSDASEDQQTDEEKRQQAKERTGQKERIEKQYAEELKGLSGRDRQEFIKEKMREVEKTQTNTDKIESQQQGARTLEKEQKVEKPLDLRPGGDVLNNRVQQIMERDRALETEQQSSDSVGGGPRSKSAAYGNQKAASGAPTIIDYSPTQISSSSQTAAVSPRPKTTPSLKKQKNGAMEVP